MAARRKAQPDEVFPNAPLEFVACEVRFPTALGLAEQPQLLRVQRAMYEWLPLVEPASVTIGTAGSSPASMQLTIGGGANVLRFIARDRRFGVLVTPEQVSIETTNYSRYAEFRQRIEQVLTSLQGVEPPIPGLTRIGLRYIDEIRVGKRVVGNADWAKYVNSKLVAPLTLPLGTQTPQTLQGAIQFELNDSRNVAMRFGAQKGRYVGDAPLRRRKSAEDGMYFYIDIDSFWTGGEPIREFSAHDILATCDDLHEPTRQLFDSVITERLRADVLRNARNGN